MKSIIATALSLAVVSAASAHSSLVAHQHPHGLSALADLDGLLLAACVAALAFAVLRRVRS